MKKLVSALLFTLVFGLCAQDTSDAGTPLSLNGSFKQNTTANAISPFGTKGFAGVEKGYYIIAGVYGKKKNVQKAIRRWERRNFDPDYFNHKDNGLHYLYIEYHGTENEANKACQNLKKNTRENLWILSVDEETASWPVESPSAEYSTVKEQNPLKKGPRKPKKSRLIRQADEFFDKMWYAQAAELYEQALEETENYPYEVLQKTADAYYFNANMEMACKWYNVLYENFKDDISADNIFRYAHALKGLEKYGRSNKFMRLYRKRTNKEYALSTEVTNTEENTPELDLEAILNTHHNIQIRSLDINSRYSDFSPMFFGEDQVVFSSARDSSFLKTHIYKWTDQPFLDLYVSRIDKASQILQPPHKFSKKINTKYHEASTTFSPDANTVYFTRNNFGKRLKRDHQGVSHLKIYRSKKVNGEWTEPQELPFNSDTYSNGHPALSPDGKKLYFISDMPGSIGMSDIFVVDVNDDGSFSRPKNLGPKINTKKKELFPFVTEEKLFFSSDGHTGLGGLDVFQAVYDANMGFHNVENLGKPINSSLDDFSYIINEKTQKGFFASNRPGGKGDDDIYSFHGPIQVKEVPKYNTIAGMVIEQKSGNAVAKALVQLFSEDKVKLQETLTNANGSFNFGHLEPTTSYTITTSHDYYFKEEMQLITQDNDSVEVEISLRKLEEMITVEDGLKKLKTEMIHFDFDQSHIREDAAKELDKLVKVMQKHTQMTIKIESHTDSRGSKAYNEYLSDLRAKSTRDYIISKGISAHRIESAIGYGEYRLLNDCDGRKRCSEENHYANRRSEFIITHM